MPLDPHRLAAALDALAGGVVYAVWHLAALWMGGLPVSLTDLLRPLVNMLLAIAAGSLCAFYLTPALTAAIPWASLREPHAVGFVTGALAWELIGVAIEVARKRAGKLGGD